jgi:ureidoglycolate lyase
MKLCRFEHAGVAAPGVVLGNKVARLRAFLPEAPEDMRQVIAQWSVLGPLLAARIVGTAAESFPLSQVRLLQPISRPGKILAIGLNYADHLEETGMEKPTEQLWFCKQPTSANGPFDPIELPAGTNSLDFEVELVAVIGKGGRNIPADRAQEAVFGYCVGNDVSERQSQLSSPQWMLGKSFDTHAPFGPWITTADEVGTPHALDISTHVNNEARQSSNTRHLIFDLWQQIEHLSRAMTLEPGDIIFTGTPAGVAMGETPPRYLEVGDAVRCTIDGLGAIENVVVRGSAQYQLGGAA